MINFLLSLFMGLIICTLIIIYVKYLIEWKKISFRSIWTKWFIYFIITFIPVLGLLIFKYGRKWIYKNSKNDNEQLTFL